MMAPLIAVLPKNAREELRVTLSEYRGHRFVDVRIYARGAASAEPVPTRAGVAVRFDNLEPLAEALLRARSAACAAGYIEGAGDGEAR